MGPADAQIEYIQPALTSKNKDNLGRKSGMLDKKHGRPVWTTRMAL